jgi:ubiquitin-conjugating enzyme E2 variant
MNIALILGELLLGWLMADLLSGLFHWWEDRAAEVAWPVIGPAIVAPNRLHHIDVLAFTRTGVISRNLIVWLVVIVMSGVWLMVTGPTLVWASASIGGLVINEVHRMAHLPASAGPVARLLQEVGAFQSPRHHAGHHRAPSDRRYCILTDWLNPWLDAAGLWSGLEWALARVGMRPNEGTR